MAQKRSRSSTHHEGREPERVVRTRRTQYLIGKRMGPPQPGTDPLDFTAVRAALEQDPDIHIRRTLAAPGLGPLATGLAASESIIVAIIPEERAEQMSRLPQLIVEPDYSLAEEGSAESRRTPSCTRSRSFRTGRSAA